MIVVDAGLATGASMRAARDGVHTVDAGCPTLAVPVGAKNTSAWFTQVVDQLVCLEIPTPFLSVSRWPRDFRQTGDDEVVWLLEQVRGNGRQTRTGLVATNSFAFLLVLDVNSNR